jgi:hypothetical protein
LGTGLTGDSRWVSSRFATLLLIQGFVFLWMTGRMSELFQPDAGTARGGHRRRSAFDADGTPRTDLTKYLTPATLAPIAHSSSSCATSGRS